MNVRCALVALFVVATPLFGRVPQARALAAEGRYDEAKRLLMPLNNDPEALRLLSRIAMAYANDEEAANLCRKAIELQPLSADYHYCAGNALRSAVQHASIFRQQALSKETREELIRAIELDPNHLAARFALLEYYIYAPAFAGGSEEKALQQAAEIRKRDIARQDIARTRASTRVRRSRIWHGRNTSMACVRIRNRRARTPRWRPSTRPRRRISRRHSKSWRP